MENLASNVDKEKLTTFFIQYGEITNTKVMIDKDTGRSKGFGFVSYTQRYEAVKAVELGNGEQLAGATIRVDYAQEREGRR